MSKTNIRSFRFSDEVAGILESQQGSSLNDKFETLILRCFWERQQIEQAITKQRLILIDLNQQVSDRRNELHNLDTLWRDRKHLTQAFSQLGLLMANYAERLKEDVTQLDTRDDAAAESKCVTSEVA